MRRDIAEADAGLVKLEIAPNSRTLFRRGGRLRGIRRGARRCHRHRRAARNCTRRCDSALPCLCEPARQRNQHTPAGGRVRIIEAEQRDGAVDIRIADTGIGISAEDLPRIWDRLFRGDRSRPERGLTLLRPRELSRHTAEALQRKSQPGAGTR